MRPLVFKPSESESIYIEDKQIKWSEYCHNNLAKDMKNKKFVPFEKVTMPLMLVMVGLLIWLIGISNIFNPIILIVCNIASMLSVSLGIFSVIGGLKNG